MFKSIRAAKTTSATPVLVAFTEDLTRRTFNDIPKKLQSAFARGVKRGGFKAKNGETIDVDGDLLIVGGGDRDSTSTASTRKAGAAFARDLERFAISAILMHPRSKMTDVEAAALSRAFAEGIGLSQWRLQGYDGTAAKKQPSTGVLSIAAVRKASNAAFKEGLLVANATNEARRIAATPPNVCNPTWVAKEARKAAKNLGLTCRVIDFKKAKELGMGGIVNVGVGSNSKPCLIQLNYRPKRTSPAAKHEHLVLVGKNMTYDSGGYSLKINNSMKGMKYDMCGGAAVFGAMHAIAQANLPIKVTALLPTAENLVSDEAYRPDDIITMYNGVTVEVTNTDAEGRLVLGDALAYACKKLKPTAIIDLATLTGGVVVALGPFSSGLWCNDDALRGEIDAASASSDEKVWRLPLWPEHREFMRSPFADILNSNPKRAAHPVQGAAFLSYFVDEDLPWAHIDIAGVGSLEANPITGHGPTGYGVRMLYDLAKQKS